MIEMDKKMLQEMVNRAKRVSEKSYSCYSGFPVGAVVLTNDDQMFEGCNVENASFSLAICAERNAVFQMVAQTTQKLVDVAIVAVVIYTPTPKPAAPCGACRQVINEFSPDALIISVCDGSDVLEKTLTELLTNAFGPANMPLSEVRGIHD